MRKFQIMICWGFCGLFIAGDMVFPNFNSLYSDEVPMQTPLPPPMPSTVAEIDKEIAQLQELREKYRASAQKQANNAMRWQFQNENYLDARKAWESVAADKKKIQEIQDRIDLLQKRRRELTDQAPPSP